MGKKKGQDLESVLARAEKFWGRGNYPLAEKEYVQALKKGYQGDLSHKLDVCRQEIAKQKSKELSKKGRIQLRKENFQAALTLFEQAQELEPQAWIQEKVNALRGLVQAENLLDSARQAEAGGEFQRAVDLYDQAGQGPEADSGILLRKAACLVKAEDFQGAVSTLAGLEVTSNEDLYNQGFALIKTGRLYEGLCAWKRVQRNETPAGQWQQFQKQLEMVREALAAEFVDRIHAGSYQDDPLSLYRQSTALLESLNDPGTDQDLKQCQQILITDLWAKQRYQDIADLLDPPSGEIDFQQLAMLAKFYFRLAEATGSHHDELRMFWLTAVYDPRLGGFFATESEPEQVRARLIQMADALIKKSRNTDKTREDSAWTRWSTDKALLETLSGFNSPSRGSGFVLCTPAFAERFGRSPQMLEFIRANKDSFQTEDDYQRVGGYYSEGGTSQYLLDEGAYAQALKALPQSAWEQGEFVKHIGLRVHFYYGLHCLETGEDKVERYFKDIAQLFDLHPKYKKQLLAWATKACEDSLAKMQRYETGLQKILSQKSSRSIAQRLSLVVSNRAVQSYNQGQISDEILASQLKQALNIDPENGHARENFNKTRIDLETEKMDQAMEKGKIKKAGSIAGKSEFPQVQESFFDSAQEIVAELLELEADKDHLKVSILRELQIACQRIDPGHFINMELAELLQNLRSS